MKRNTSNDETHPNKIRSNRREFVEKTILDITEKLLLEKNPNEISVREIAELANVKHPIIHRYFGTKDDLIKSVHSRSVENVKDLVGQIQSLEGNIGLFFQAVKKNKSRQIALARAMIDGVDPHLLQNQFPIMQSFLGLIEKKRLESGKEAKFDSRIFAATMTATALGWILYEPFLLASARLEQENKDEVISKVAEVLEEVLKINS